jgi:hypothetical protein
LAIAPRTAFAPYRDPSPKAQAPTKGAELTGRAHCALAEPLPPRHGCPARQAPGSAPFPNCAATQASSLGPVNELVVVCCLGPATSSPEQPLPRWPSPDHAAPTLRPPPRRKYSRARASPRSSPATPQSSSPARLPELRQDAPPISPKGRIARPDFFLRSFVQTKGITVSTQIFPGVLVQKDSFLSFVFYLQFVKSI